jgi:predicted metal-dependent hydrolase
LENTLYSELFKIYEQMKKKQGIEVLGDLDFEIIKKIDHKEQRIAKLKGNRILVKKNAVMLPRLVLEYVVAHEIAHITTKRHTKLFWKTVELMCPNFEEAQELLSKYAHFFAD